MTTSKSQQFRLWSTAADRRYFCGFTGSAGFVLQRVAPGVHTTLITDGRYAEQAKEQCADRAEVHIAGRLCEALLVCTRAGDTILFDQGNFSYGQIVALQRELVHRYLIPLGAAAGQQRACKNEKELACIRQACLMAEEGLFEVLDRAAQKMFATEKDFRIALEQALVQRGAVTMPFDFIVAQAQRSALPHGIASDRHMDNQPFTVDWGSESDGYFSDQTVTVVPDRSQWTERWQQMYDLVYQAQQAAMDTVREGVPVAAVDAAARSVIEDGGYGAQFVHSTGHGVGLEIHEFPGISARVEAVLQAGMVITIEPGVYVPGFGGVRLEDTILVTETGYERLTRIDKARPLFLDERI